MAGDASGDRGGEPPHAATGADHAAGENATVGENAASDDTAAAGENAAADDTATAGENAAAGEEHLFRGYAGRLFVVVTLASVSIRLGKSIIPPLLPAIIEDLAISPSQAGVALSLMSVVFALAQFPGGRLSDQLSRKTVLVASLAIAFVGSLALVVSNTYAAFLAAVVVLGVGRGLFPTAARALLSELYVERRGRAFGIHMISSDVSGVAAAGLAVATLSVATWHGAFVPVAAGVGLLLVAVLVLSREPLVLKRVPLDVRETGTRVFVQPRLRRLLVAYSLYIFTIRGILSFLPTFLVVDHGWSAALASGAYALLYASGAAIKPVAGVASDRFPRPLVAGATLLVGIVGIGLLLVAPATPVVVLGVLIYAVGHKAYGPVMQAFLMDTFPEGSMGGDLGAFRTVYMTLGSTGPAYVGFVAGRWSYTLAFAGFVLTFLVAGAITVWLGRTAGSSPPA